MKSEKEEMLGGEPYNPFDAQLVAERQRARLLFKAFNETSDDQPEERLRLFWALIPSVGVGLLIEPPFYCDYGGNITIGDHVLFGPGVQIYAATHPLSSVQRRAGVELGKPVTIGDDVWVDGGVIICPGVTIGPRSVIGAGSVVTKDIPEDVLAYGNPCRVVRAIEG